MLKELGAQGDEYDIVPKRELVHMGLGTQQGKDSWFTRVHKGRGTKGAMHMKGYARVILGPRNMGLTHDEWVHKKGYTRCAQMHDYVWRHACNIISIIGHCATHLKICVVPRAELTASQAPSLLKLKSRITAGVIPRANLYRCTAEASGLAEPLPRPLPVPCHGQMWKMCTL